MWKGLPLALVLICLSACGITPERLVSPPQFERALYFAELSNIAYKPTNEIEPALDSMGLRLRYSQTIAQTDIQYFVAQDPQSQQQFISIRGTDNVRNAITDAEFFFVEVNALEIKAHRGFTQVTNDILSSLPDGVLDKNRPVSITGHSLGGAAAVLLAMHLTKKGYKIKVIYTFGQPKVTDRHGAKKYGQLPLIRYANNKDIVPLVPPLAIDSQDKWDIYWHLGNEVLLYSDARYTELGPDASVIRGLKGYYTDLIKNRDLSAHKLKNYISSIKSKINASEPVELSFP